jgi:hypothetical protein
MRRRFGRPGSKTPQVQGHICFVSRVRCPAQTKTSPHRGKGFVNFYAATGGKCKPKRLKIRSKISLKKLSHFHSDAELQEYLHELFVKLKVRHGGSNWKKDWPKTKKEKRGKRKRSHVPSFEPNDVIAGI